jgi:tRNA pseudouridine38-40 synthase
VTTRAHRPITLRLLVAYDGARFAGWQRQKNVRTVQASLEDALARVTERRAIVVGAGRTDAGVHALGQVAHARVVTRLSPAVLRRALNAVLPDDVIVRRLAEAPGRFHAQHDARWKWYRYRIAVGPVRPLLDRAYVLYVPQPLNVAAMRRAARAWVGRHDFRAFHSSGQPVASTRRRVYRLRLTREKGSASRSGPFLCIDVVADGFLYHMVRRMVGALLEIGRGRPMPPVAPTAPALGLCLMRVTYD